MNLYIHLKDCSDCLHYRFAYLSMTAGAAWRGSRSAEHRSTDPGRGGETRTANQQASGASTESGAGGMARCQEPRDRRPRCGRPDWAGAVQGPGPGGPLGRGWSGPLPFPGAAPAGLTAAAEPVAAHRGGDTDVNGASARDNRQRTVARERVLRSLCPSLCPSRRRPPST